MVMEDDDLKQALMSLIGNNVRRCRMERGLTQQELADMVNIDTSTIGRIEGGSRMMSMPFFFCPRAGIATFINSCNSRLFRFLWGYAFRLYPLCFPSL